MPPSLLSSSRLGSLIRRIVLDDQNFEVNFRVKHTIKINTDFTPQTELLAEHHKPTWRSEKSFSTSSDSYTLSVKLSDSTCDVISDGNTE